MIDDSSRFQTLAAFSVNKCCLRSVYCGVWVHVNYDVDVHSVDLFKTRLDTFWRCQDVVFDCKADLTGTGDRSESSVFSA